MKYIIDTHTLVWYFTGDERLSRKVKLLIQEAEQGKNEIVIPVIVLLEALDIQEKKKIRFNLGKLFDFIESKENFQIFDLDFEAVKIIAKTGKGLDLHDRVIATAGKIFNAVVLTRDTEIKKVVKTLW